MSRQLDIWHLPEFVLEVPMVIMWDLKLPTHLTTNRTIWLASTCSTVFLSLVELECWSADVAFFPSSTPTVVLQHSKREQGFSPDPSLPIQKGLGSRLWYT